MLLVISTSNFCRVDLLALALILYFQIFWSLICFHLFLFFFFLIWSIFIYFIFFPFHRFSSLHCCHQSLLVEIYFGKPKCHHQKRKLVLFSFLNFFKFLFSFYLSSNERFHLIWLLTIIFYSVNLRLTKCLILLLLHIFNFFQFGFRSSEGEGVRKNLHLIHDGNRK